MTSMLHSYMSPYAIEKIQSQFFFGDVGSLKVHDECEEFGDDLDEYDVEEFEAGDDDLS